MISSLEFHYPSLLYSVGLAGLQTKHCANEPPAPKLLMYILIEKGCWGSGTAFEFLKISFQTLVLGWVTQIEYFGNHLMDIDVLLGKEA